MKWWGKKSEFQENNVVLTGLPRSGTTLTCFLLNKMPDTVALHEPMYREMFSDASKALQNVEDTFVEMRKSLLKEGRAVSRVKDGKIPDNPFDQGQNEHRRSIVKRQWVDFEGTLSPNFTLIIKHNGTFTYLLKDLAKLHPCFAIIRNPLSVLASWNSLQTPLSRGRLPVEEQLDRTFSETQDKMKGKLDRQLFILNWFFEHYAQMDQEHIIRYEEVIATNGGILEKILPEAKTLNHPLESKNTNKLYDTQLMQRIGKRLMETDSACWKYYEKADVARVIDQITHE